MSDQTESKEPECEPWVAEAIEIVSKLSSCLNATADRRVVWKHLLELRDAVSGKNDIFVSLKTAVQCFDPQKFEDGERSCRRGYAHGYGAALDDNGRPLDVRNKHADSLQDWRASDCTRMVGPPSCGSGHSS